MASAPKTFFLYAHACGDVLVKRGTITKKQLEGIRRKLCNEGKAKLNPLIFKKGFTRLKDYAKKKGKRLNDEVASRYFLTQHNKSVMTVIRTAEDVNPKKCFISPGMMVSVDARRGTGVAFTPFGRRKVIIRFAPKLNAGDLVSLHYDYACEKISRGDFKRLWRELK